MAGFKLTCWNIEYADRTLTDLEGPDGPTAWKRRNAERKIEAIAAQIAELDADILFVCEGPRSEARARTYFARAAPDHELITHGDPTGKAYATLGIQWLWFLVRKRFIAAAGITPRLLPIATWRAFTESESRGRTRDGRWLVALPTFNKASGLAGPAELVRHGHYRHPQTLVFDYRGRRIEIIGVHLKSKFVDQRDPLKKWNPPASDSFDDIAAAMKASPGFITEAVKARAKTTSEAADVRSYIDRRFAQEPAPAIFLLGDVNDGPGKELIEDWFLLHDLISNLQGEIFFARKFLNHALFDYPDPLRWTVQFEDALDPRRNPNILLDHILFTQGLTGESAWPLRVRGGAGKVEHDVHERINSLLPRGMTTSDHRPVSVTVTDVTVRPAMPGPSP
jgi:hypothetical protein